MKRKINYIEIFNEFVKKSEFYDTSAFSQFSKNNPRIYINHHCFLEKSRTYPGVIIEFSSKGNLLERTFAEKKILPYLKNLKRPFYSIINFICN